MRKFLALTVSLLILLPANLIVTAQSAAAALQITKTVSAAKAKTARSSAPQPAARPKLEGFDAVVAQAMTDWKVPGVALAVVQNGEVILLKGYGFRDVKNQLPVTPKTLFAIGSITKSFTVATLATLVDEGKLDWDRSEERRVGKECRL